MRFYFYLLLILPLSFSFSQDYEDQIQKYYQKYEKLANRKADSSLFYLFEAKKLNKKLKSEKWDAQIYYGIGYSYFVRQSYVLSLEYLNKAVTTSLRAQEYDVLSKSFNLMGLIFSYQNDFHRALDYYNKSLDISEKKEEMSIHTIATLTNIADLYISQKDTLNARQFYLQAKEIGERNNKKLNLATVYNNMAVSYMTSNKDSTEYYLKKAIDLYKDTQNTYGQISAQNNLATSYLNFGSQDDFGQSLHYLMESLKLSIESKNVQAEFFTLFYLGNFYEKGEIDYFKAKHYYERASKLIKKGIKMESTVELYKRLSDVYSELGNFKAAYTYQKLQHNLQDSVFSVERSKQFIETLTKFDVERKNNQIQLLNKEKEIQRGYKIAVIIGSILFILPLLLIAFFYRKRLIYQETISSQDKLIFEKEKETLRAKNLIEGQKLERSRIANELHDGVGGKLSAIKMKMDQLNTTNIQNPELKECINQLQEATKEIRIISHELNENKIDELDFVSLLQGLIKDYQFYFSGEIHLNIYPSHKFNEIEDFRKHYLYRTIQEILSNALKHAQAENIYIDCTFDDLYRIIIEDDGIGYDMKKVKKGMGMTTIQKRVQTMKGTLHIDSLVNRGTTLILEIPNDKCTYV